MNGINKCFISGNLGVNPTIEVYGESKKARLFIITNSSQKVVNKETGEITYQQVSNPVNVECWGSLAEYCEKFLKKGSGVIIEGSYEFNEYEKDGEKKSSPYIKAFSVTGVGSNGISEIEKLKITLGHIQFAEEQQLDLGRLRERIKAKIVELSTKVESVSV